MIVGSKTTLTMKELTVIKNSGVKFIEIQTVLEDFENLEDTIARKHWVKQHGMKVYAIGIPRLNRYGQPCIVGEKNPLWRKENMNLIKKGIILAEKFSDSSSINIIIPLGGAVEVGTHLPDFTKEKKILFQKDVFELSNYVKEYYPSVRLLFKNNPLQETRGGEPIYYGYGYEEDFFHWIKELKASELGICLDVGNALVTSTHNKRKNSDSEFSSITHFLYRYAPILKMIHLSQIDEASGSRFGYSKDLKKDVDALTQVMIGLYDMSYNAPITINANEENLSEVEQFIETRLCMIEALRKKSP